MIVEIIWGIELLFKISDRGAQCGDKELDFIPKIIKGLEQGKWGSVD